MQTTVYKLYDAEGVLLYVGITKRGTQRLNDHLHAKEWWPEVATVQFEHFPNRAEAINRETQLILSENPRYNIQYNTQPEPEQFKGPTIKHELLTVPEVAERLRVRPEAVRRYIREKRLQAFLPGGVKTGYRISESEVDRFIREARKAS